MTVTDWIQAISMLVLVIVTAVYAWSTHAISKATEKQAEAGMKQAEASVRMAEQVKNTISPSITMQWMGPDPNQGRISADIKNAGFGPALNLICYLTHKDFSFTYKFDGYTTFDVGQKYQLSLHSEKFDFKAWNGLAINCDYESVIGERFSSILRCESQEKRSLEIKRLNRGDSRD